MSPALLCNVSRVAPSCCQAAYLGPLGIFWVIAVTLFFSGFSLAALLVGVVCALCLLLFVTRQSRIRFGAANLKVYPICSVVPVAVLPLR